MIKFIKSIISNIKSNSIINSRLLEISNSFNKSQGDCILNYEHDKTHIKFIITKFDKKSQVIIIEKNMFLNYFTNSSIVESLIEFSDHTELFKY